MATLNNVEEQNKVTLAGPELVDARIMIEALAAGHLNLRPVNKSNPLCESLDLLQTNLQKLNWVMQGLAHNDYSPKAELKGDFAASFNDMLKSMEQYKKDMALNAQTDPLTGIPNRLSFMHALDGLWNNNKKFFITFIDLDNLKYRNDHYGHAEGDRYLRYACNFISLHGLDDDQLYRLGGDEFVLISFHGPLEALDQRIEEIRTKFSTNQHYNSDLVDSFSHGSVIMDPSGSKTTSDLLGEADQKMYAYKAAAKAAARAAYQVTDAPADNSIMDSSGMLFEALAHCAANQYIYVTDMATGLTRWSANAVRDLGLPSEYFDDVDSIWMPRVHPDDKDAYAKDLGAVFTGKKLYHDMQYRLLDASGNYITALCRGCMLYDSNNNPAIFAGVLTNLGLADNIDSVTSLPNLYDFIEQIDNLRKEGKGVTIYGVTFSNFKGINKLYGRDNGDSLLKQFATKISALLKDKCQIYRLDGLDFALVFNKTTKKELTAIHRQVAKIAKKELLICDTHLDIIAKGAAMKFNRISFEATTILAELQSRLNKIKNSIDEDFVYSNDSLKEQTIRSLDILNKVQRSAENDCRGFYILYQPQVDANGKVHGAEALLRWRHPLYGEIDAEEYLTRLEKNECFYNLCMWSLRTALIDFKSLLDLNPELTLSANITYCQFASRNFCKDIVAILQQTGFPAKNLLLEFENNCYSLNKSLLRQKIKTLQEQKLKVAIDKYDGTDINLSMMRDMPLDAIIFDACFVASEKFQESNMLILKCLLECASAFNVKVCANRVESKDIHDFLMNAGIGYFQGYYYSKPLAITQLQQFINTHNQ